MLFSQRIDQRHTPRTARRCRLGRRFRPRIEQLEDRLLLATVNWIGGSGDWNSAANWLDATTLTNHVPVASDDAVINVAPSITVTHSTLTHTVRSLTINETFTLSGGTLIVSGNLVQQNANTFTMTGGTLRSAKVVGGGGAVLAVSGGTLDAVTLGATIGGVPTAATVQGNTPGFFVTGGLTFVNGSLVDLSHQVLLNGDQTLGGAGEIRFRAAASLIANSGQTIFGAGLTIHRADANFSTLSIGNGASILNQGTIRADAGGTIRVLGNFGLGNLDSAFFTNAAGGVLAADGGTLWLGADWSNAGQIVVNNSTLNLGGGFTTDRIGSITRTGGTINLLGLLNNTGDIFALDATTGSWNLGVSGRLRGGSLVTSGGAVLTATGGILDGVTLGATVGGVLASATVRGDAGGAGQFIVTGGLTFANGSLVDLATSMSLDGDQTLGGAGEIRFRGTGGISNTHQTTFGPGLTIHRADIARSDINIVSGSITNQGTIRADAGGEIRVTGNPGAPITNAVGGLLSADGGTLSLLSEWSNAGQIVVNNGTLNLGGRFTTVGLGTYTRTGGTINLTGLLDNSGRMLVLDAVTGSWNLTSGTLYRGALVTSGGAVLAAAGGTLDGVTLGGFAGGVPASATVQGNGSAGFSVTGGLTFANGSLLDLGNPMNLVGDQTVGGDGEIRFRASAGITNEGQTTFGPGLTIHRSDANSSNINIISGAITNRGTIRADAGGTIRVFGDNFGTSFTNVVGGVLSADGGTLTLDGAWSNTEGFQVTGGTLNLRGAWSNTGAFQGTAGTLTLGGAWSNSGPFQLSGTTLSLGGTWSNSGPFQLSGTTLSLGGTWSNSGPFQVIGTTLNLGGTWSNTGAFQVIGGTINLGGNFTTSSIGAFTNTGGIVNLTGTLDNTGSTLALDAATGSWNLIGGTIVGGRVSTAGAAALVAGSTRGTLQGVTLAGTITGIRIAATGGLTLEQGLIDVALLDFIDTQTVGGSGAVVFSANNPNNAVQVLNSSTLTVGPSVTIRGVTGFIDTFGSGFILNQGTIASDGGGTLTVRGISNFAAGTLTGGAWQVAGNSTLRLVGADISTNAADILVDGANARLFSDLNGSTNALAGLAANTAAGRLRLLNGASLTTSASNVNNQGSLTVGAGSTLVASTVTVGQTGTLAGSGTVLGNVVNNGQVRPVTSPGSLTINGS